MIKKNCHFNFIQHTTKHREYNVDYSILTTQLVYTPSKQVSVYTTRTTQSFEKKKKSLQTWAIENQSLFKNGFLSSLDTSQSIAEFLLLVTFIAQLHDNDFCFQRVSTS